VTFIEGGSCAAPTTTYASNISLNAIGHAAFSTANLAAGTHTVIACYGGSAGFQLSEGSDSHTVNPGPTVTTLTVTPSSQQYSDRVTFNATVTPSQVNGVSVTGSVQFKLNGTNIGSPVALAADGTASLADAQVRLGQGTYTADAVFTTTNPTFASSNGSASLSVSREDADVRYDEANPAALQVSSAGGSLNAGALSFSIGVQEHEPDVAVSPGTAGSGSVLNAGLAVSLLPVGPGSSYTLTCTATGVSGTGYAAVRGFTCTNPAAIAVNVYEVHATVTGAFYTGEYSDEFAVFDPSLGFVTGGGTVSIDGDRVRFGLTTKYKKNGDGAKGNLMVVRHHADGTTSSFTSNALSAIAIGEDASVPMGWAAVTGKSTYTTWDPAAHGYVTVGNQSFTVYVEDRDNPGNGNDRVWVGGPAKLSLSGTPATARINAATITAGSITVPHRGP
jgi:predicted RNA-binding protein with TRAM domain